LLTEKQLLEKYALEYFLKLEANKDYSVVKYQDRPDAIISNGQHCYGVEIAHAGCDGQDHTTLDLKSTSKDSELRFQLGRGKHLSDYCETPSGIGILKNTFFSSTQLKEKIQDILNHKATKNYPCEYPIILLIRNASDFVGMELIQDDLVIPAKHGFCKICVLSLNPESNIRDWNILTTLFSSDDD
jgi:hypothetical protein